MNSSAKPVAEGKKPNKPRQLSIIHFNDLYELDGEPSADQFVLAVNKIREQEDSLVFFSGDLWSPSKLCLIKKGQHMVYVINKLGVTASCIGNHDLDLGEEQAIVLNKQCKFPWLLSNLHFNNGSAIGASKDFHIIEHQGFKIGIIGLAESEWIDTLSNYDTNDLDFDDPSAVGDELAAKLKKEDGCEIVIALTHLTLPNDKLLAKETKNIDLFLGGHDHFYHVEQIGQNLLIKSGYDFKMFNELKLFDNGSAADSLVKGVEMQKKGVAMTEKTIKEGSKCGFKIRDNRFVAVVKPHFVAKDAPRDPEITKYIKQEYAEYYESMKQQVCALDYDFDTTLSIVRRKEAAMGNFLADIMRKQHNADCAFINSGNIRANKYYEKNSFLNLGDWAAILPFNVAICLAEVTGTQLLSCLENSVSKVPSPDDGRFLQVSHIRFTYDLRLPAGQRIIKNSVVIGGQPLDLRKKYKVALPGFLLNGKDGFEALLEAKVIVDMENAPELKQVITENMFSLAEGKDAEYNKYKELEQLLSKDFVKAIIADKEKKHQEKMARMKDRFHTALRMCQFGIDPTAYDEGYRTQHDANIFKRLSLEEAFSRLRKIINNKSAEKSSFLKELKQTAQMQKKDPNSIKERAEKNTIKPPSVSQKTFKTATIGNTAQPEKSVPESGNKKVSNNQKSLNKIEKLSSEELVRLIKEDPSAMLSMPLLKRIRQYQMIARIVPCPQGHHVPVIASTLDYRIIKVDHDDKVSPANPKTKQPK